MTPRIRVDFPVCVLWGQKARIVEVKGPNDSLSVKQEVWLDYLVSCGAVAEVCYVEGGCVWKVDSIEVTLVTFSHNKIYHHVKFVWEILQFKSMGDQHFTSILISII